MSDTGQAILAELKAIHATLKQALRKTAPARPAGIPEIAPDSDLDSKFGDPVVKHDPHKWEGEPMKGRPLSQCPPDYLKMYAEMKEYFAVQDDEKGLADANGKPKSRWSWMEASRARGWMKRNAGGVKKKPIETQPQWSSGWDDVGEQPGHDEDEDQPF